jgi:hypothetical protein
MIIDEDIYIQHFGVKGMRWGVRNDDDESSGSDSSGEKKPRFTPRQKKAIIAGAAIAGTLLVAYGGYRLSQGGQLNAASLRAKEALGKQKGPWKKNDLLADKNLSADQIQNLVNKQANPGYGKPGTKLNCRRATFAYEMRRRGFDVSATRTRIDDGGQNFTGVYNALNSEGRVVGSSKRALRRELAREARRGSSSLSDAYDALEGRGRSSVQPIDGSHVSGIFRGLLGQPNGARGEVSMNWTSGGRHSMAWEIIGGRPHVFDPQTGEHFASARDLRRSIGESIGEASFLRLDDAPMNTDFLQRWLRNA